MLYTPAINKALKICGKVHLDQTDKNEVPYLAHPLHLAEQMDTEEEICTALLHDVLEDGLLSSDNLLEQGIPETVVEAVLLLTKKEDMPYFDYIQSIADGTSENQATQDSQSATFTEEVFSMARKVKLADLRHNSELGRLSVVSSRDIKRLEKYRKARTILGDLTFKYRTPFGSITVEVNKRPYAFHVKQDLEQRGISLEIDTLPLSIDDLLMVRYDFGGKIVDYESNETTVTTIYQKGQTLIRVEAFSGSKFNYSEHAPYQLINRTGTYKIVNDPIKFRSYPHDHIITLSFSWEQNESETYRMTL